MLVLPISIRYNSCLVISLIQYSTIVEFLFHLRVATYKFKIKKDTKNNFIYKYF